MYAQVDKSKENKSRAVTNSVTQKKSSGKQGFGFVDNRKANNVNVITPRKGLKPTCTASSNGDLTIQRVSPGEVNTEHKQYIKNTGADLRSKMQQVKAGFWNPASIPVDICNKLRKPRNNELSPYYNVTQAKHPVISHDAFKANSVDAFANAYNELQTMETVVNKAYDEYVGAETRYTAFKTEVIREYNDFNNIGGNRGRNNGGAWKINNVLIKNYLTATATGPAVKLRGLSDFTWQISDTAPKALHRWSANQGKTFIWHYFG